MAKPRMHPRSWSELRQLVKLHGADDIRTAISMLEREQEELELFEAERQLDLADRADIRSK